MGHIPAGWGGVGWGSSLQELCFPMKNDFQGLPAKLDLLASILCFKCYMYLINSAKKIKLNQELNMTESLKKKKKEERKEKEIIAPENQGLLIY